MQKSFIRVAALLAAAAFNANAVAADLIGDTLSFLRAYPNLETRYGQAISDSTVAPGMADQVTWRFAANGPALLAINPEADRIHFNFPVRFVTEGSATIFDGVVISGFDRAIQSVSLLDNTAGGTVLLSHGPHEIQVNLRGAFQANQSFAIGVSVVPEPASMALMALGAGVLALRMRRHAVRRAD
jgi:PEP-CTERM motif